MEIAEEWIKAIAVISGVVTMLIGLWVIYAKLKAKEHGFWPNSLRVMGVVLFTPILMILAVITAFKTETLAALRSE